MTEYKTKPYQNRIAQQGGAAGAPISPPQMATMDKGMPVAVLIADEHQKTPEETKSRKKQFIAAALTIPLVVWAVHDMLSPEDRSLMRKYGKGPFDKLFNNNKGIT